MSEDLTKTNLMELVAEAINGSLGEDRITSLLEALFLFGEDGGAEGLVIIAKSDLSIKVRRRAMELLFTSPPDGMSAQRQAAAFEMADQFLSGSEGEMQRAVVEILVEKASESGDIPDDILSQICTLAMENGQSRNMRRAAQNLILFELEQDTNNVGVARAALKVRLTESDDVLRLQFAESAAQTLPPTIDRLHSRFEGDDWDLLAKAGRLLGILPAHPKGPNLFWWPSSDSRRMIINDIGLLGFLLPGLAALLTALFLGLLVQNSAPNGMSMPLFYVLVSAVGSAFLGMLCVWTFPPISLFSHRYHGNLAQIIIWLIPTGILAFVGMYLLSANENHNDALNPAFFESFLVLFLALALVRPVTLATHGIGGKARRREISAVLLGTLIPVGVLCIGAYFGPEDGRALELQALFGGAPLAAAFATVFALLDNSRPDWAAKINSSVSKYALGAATMAGLVGIVSLTLTLVQPVSNHDVNRLVHLGTQFPVEVRVRKTIGVQTSLQTDARIVDIQSSLGPVAALNIANQETHELFADTYDMCIRRGSEACIPHDDIHFIAEWRLLIEMLDSRILGSRTVTDKNVPSGFERVTIVHEMDAKDQRALIQFEAMIEDIQDTSDGLGASNVTSGVGYFIATQDTNISGGTDSLRILRGTLIGRNPGQDQASRLFVVDGHVQGDATHFSLPDYGLDPQHFLQVSDLSPSHLDIVGNYLRIALNPDLHTRASNQSLQFAIRNELAHAGALNPDGYRTGDYFLSTSNADSSGAGVFKIIDDGRSRQFDNGDPQSLGQVSQGARAPIVARLIQGWSQVPSAAFCYQFVASDDVTLLPSGPIASEISTALETLAERHAALDFWIDLEAADYDVPSRNCPKFTSGQTGPIWEPDTEYFVTQDWIDRGTVVLATNEPLIVHQRFSDGWSDTQELEPASSNTVEIRLLESGISVQALCIQLYAEHGCDTFPDQQVTESGNVLAVPESGNFLGNRYDQLKDAETFAAFASQFIAMPLDPATATIALTTRRVDVTPGAEATTKSDAENGVDQDLPTSLEPGSLLSLAGDKANALLTIPALDVADANSAPIIELAQGDWIGLDQDKAAEQFQLVVRYSRALARFTGNTLPGGSDLHPALDALDVRQLDFDTVYALQTEDAAGAVASLESNSEFLLFTQDRHGVTNISDSDESNTTTAQTVRIASAGPADFVKFCIADTNAREPCDIALGLNPPMLLLPAESNVIHLEAGRSAGASTGWMTLNRTYALDQWPGDISDMLVRSDRDIVVKVFFEGGGSDILDGDNVSSRDPVYHSGEMFSLGIPVPIAAICVMDYSVWLDNENSCPLAVPANAAMVLPFEGTDQEVRITEREILPLSPSQVFTLPANLPQSAPLQIQASRDFQAVLGYQNGTSQVIDAINGSGGFSVELPMASDQAASGICIRRSDADRSCDVLAVQPDLVNLTGPNSEILFVRSQ